VPIRHSHNRPITPPPEPGYALRSRGEVAELPRVQHRPIEFKKNRIGSIISSIRKVFKRPLSVFKKK